MGDQIDTSKWSWWWSRDQERYQGPHGSREQAIIDAWADDVTGAVHVMQAIEGAFHCRLFEAERLAEQFDDDNYEMGDPDGDGPSANIPNDVWKGLADTLNARLKAAVMQHCPSAWAFGGSTMGEWVDVTQPKLAALPPEAAAIIAEMADGYKTETGYCAGHVETLMGRLKSVLAPPPAIATNQAPGREG